MTAGPVPDPIDGHTLYVDGSPLNIIEVKQADIHPTTIVHIPEIDVVVAGDSIYNEIHAMLGLSTPAEWQDWLETVDVVESLKPRMIVAGHRRPDGDDYATDRMIAQTRSYIKDFAAAYEVAEDADALVSAMTAKYPYHGNLWTLAILRPVGDDEPRRRAVCRGYHGLTQQDGDGRRRNSLRANAFTRRRWSPPLGAQGNSPSHDPSTTPSGLPGE